MSNWAVPKQVEVLGLKWETPDTYTISVNFTKKTRPGQFVQLGLLGHGESPISIASHRKNCLDLSIRKVGQITDQLSYLKKGDSVTIRGPFGRPFPMNLFRSRDLLLIGAGCGVASLKGIIDEIEQNPKKFGTLHLYLGYLNH